MYWVSIALNILNQECWRWVNTFYLYLNISKNNLDAHIVLGLHRAQYLEIKGVEDEKILHIYFRIFETNSLDAHIVLGLHRAQYLQALRVLLCDHKHPKQRIDRDLFFGGGWGGRGLCSDLFPLILSWISRREFQKLIHKQSVINEGKGGMGTGRRRLIGSPKLQIIFHKRATKYRSLLRKMTYKDKGSCESSPPCSHTHTQTHIHTHAHTQTPLQTANMYISTYTYIYICIHL